MNSKSPRRNAILNAATGMTLRAFPRIPNRMKRLLLAGRSITIDGNTSTPHCSFCLPRSASSGGTVWCQASMSSTRDHNWNF